MVIYIISTSTSTAMPLIFNNNNIWRYSNIHTHTQMNMLTCTEAISFFTKNNIPSSITSNKPAIEWNTCCGHSITMFHPCKTKFCLRIFLLYNNRYQLDQRLDIISSEEKKKQKQTTTKKQNIKYNNKTQKQ